KGEDGVTTVVGGVPEAPSDGKTRGRKDGAWVEVTGGTGGEISNKGAFAPTDNTKPASQKSTADYINRDLNNYRGQLQVSSLDFLVDITQSGVYGFTGQWSKITIQNGPSYFNELSRKVSGTVTFNNSAIQYA